MIERKSPTGFLEFRLSCCCLAGSIVKYDSSFCFNLGVDLVVDDRFTGVFLSHSLEESTDALTSLGIVNLENEDNTFNISVQWTKKLIPDSATADMKHALMCNNPIIQQKFDFSNTLKKITQIVPLKV